jgi:hypothetical protein
VVGTTVPRSLSCWALARAAAITAAADGRLKDLCIPNNFCFELFLFLSSLSTTSNSTTVDDDDDIFVVVAGWVEADPWSFVRSITSSTFDVGFANTEEDDDDEEEDGLVVLLEDDITGAVAAFEEVEEEDAVFATLRRCWDVEVIDRVAAVLAEEAELGSRVKPPNLNGSAAVTDDVVPLLLLPVVLDGLFLLLPVIVPSLLKRFDDDDVDFDVDEEEEGAVVVVVIGVLRLPFIIRANNRCRSRTSFSFLLILVLLLFDMIYRFS